MRRRSALLLVAALSQSFLEGASLLLLLPVLGSLGIGTMGSGGATDAVRGLFNLLRVPYTLGTTLTFLVLVAAAAAFAAFASAVLADKILRRFVTTMRLDAYEALVGSNTAFAVRTRMGDATAMLTKFAEQCGIAFIGLVRFITGLLVCTVLVGVALSQSWQFVFAIGVLVVLGGVPFWLSSRVTQRLALQSHAYVREVSAHVSEHLRLLPAIRALGTQNQSLKMLSVHVRASEAAIYALKRRTAAIKASLDPLLLALLCVAIYFGVSVFQLGVDQLLLLVGVFVRLVPALMRIVVQNQQLSVQLVAYQDLLDFTRAARAAAEPRGSRPPPDDLATGVDLSHVSTSDGETPILVDVSLRIEACRVTGLIGASGSGKTSVVNAVLGLADLRAGFVAIDGVPLAVLDAHAWRRRVGYVSQTPPIFSSTIRENLTFWNPVATDDEMWEALGHVGLEAKVASVPEKLDSAVGEQGNLISGGERHRLAIAGALLRRPTLLILDEPTSALDPESTRVIIDLIACLKEHTTVFVIAHDLEVVRSADTIYVMDGGRVVESGSWKELMHSEGRFFSLASARGRA